ncbi:MAG: hypothetical protein F6K31_42715 [Symploca sp. SIO2G7]|nr:hypothetical protein [Symploca sp. SIO2G7]
MEQKPKISEREAWIQQRVDYCITHVQETVINIVKDYCSFSEEGQTELLKHLPPEAHKSLIEAGTAIERLTQAIFSSACSSLGYNFELKGKDTPKHLFDPINCVDLVETSGGVINLYQVVTINPNCSGLCKITFANGDTIELPQEEYQYLEKVLEPLELFAQEK